VHSSKDLPAVLPDGLAIAGVLPREDPLDAVVLPMSTVRPKPDTTHDQNRMSISDPSAVSTVSGVVTGFSRTVTSIDQLAALLGPSPSFGTGSVRRMAQLLRLFPKARFTPIRGNLDTRLRKLDNGEHDALVLAGRRFAALGLDSRISLRLPAAVSVPAPGQGIIAIENPGGRRPRPAGGDDDQ